MSNENNSSAPLKTAEGAYPALPAGTYASAYHSEATVFSAEDMRAYAAQAVAAQAAVAVLPLQFKLLGAANYIDVLGGDSKSYRAALAATPALPSTEDSSAGDLAEVQVEPVALQICSELRPRTESEKAAYLAGVADGRMYAERDADTAPQAQPADALDAEIAKLKKTCQELGNMFHDQIVAQQAAWIEWQHGAGAEAGMQWIENGLCGPGHIPDEDEPYGTEAQAYFDANKSDPFPACYCGRPSNILWMGKGFCSDAHHDEHRAAMAAAQEGGNAAKEA